MFDHTHYVAILKGKQGEHRALEVLAPASKDRLTPLIEVMLTPAGAADQARGLRSTAATLEKSWGTGRPFFVDLSLLPGGGARQATRMFREIRAKGLQAIPATDLGRPPEYQQAVAQIVRDDGRGVCLRLRDEDFEDAATLAAGLEDLGRRFGVERRVVDIVVDLRSINPSQMARLTALCRANLQALPHIGEWRTLTVASTAFPQSMAGLTPYQVNTKPRADWTLWRGLLAGPQRIRRLPTFGDYAIQHPDLVDYDPQKMTMSPNVRYTVADAWLILRGRSVKSHGWDQAHGLARELVQRADFRGQQHCPGCSYITQTAQRQVGTGNATVWRRVGTVHHLTTVTEEIASFPWPSGAS